ncbi:MAG: preprotein translocase subunit SecG [Patescibacteria group bacterium]|mgnify:FL=1
MKQWIPLIQIIIGLLLSTAILMQAKGTGLGRSVGPSSYHARRGMEKMLFKATIALSVIFVAISVLSQFLP